MASVFGVLVLVGGLSLLGFGLFGEAGIQATGAGAALVILGAAMVSQWVTRPALAVIGWPVSRLGVRGQLAQQNAQRSPRRTASTASALMIGLGLVAFALIFGASIRASVTAAIDEAFLADFQLTSINFDDLPAEAAETVARLPEAGTVAALTGVDAKVEDESPQLALGIDADKLSRTLAVETPSGDLDGFGARDIAVAEPAAERLGLAVGETVDVTFADRERALEVAAVYIDNGGVGSEFLVDESVGAEADPDAGDLGVLVALADGVDVAAGRQAIEGALADLPTVRVDDSQDIKDQVAEGVNQLLGLLGALLGLSILIALFGIVVGVVFGWLAVRALADEGLGTFSVPVAQLALGVVAAALAGVVAAILPARRAARTDILQALAVE